MICNCRALLQFEKHRLVKCINPEEKRGRVYQLTELEKEAFKLIIVRKENEELQ